MGSSQTETLLYRSVNMPRYRFEVWDFRIMAKQIRSISCLVYGSLLCFCKLVWALWENNALQLQCSQSIDWRGSKLAKRASHETILSSPFLWLRKLLLILKQKHAYCTSRWHVNSPHSTFFLTFSILVNLSGKRGIL